MRSAEPSSRTRVPRGAERTQSNSQAHRPALDALVHRRRRPARHMAPTNRLEDERDRGRCRPASGRGGRNGLITARACDRIDRVRRALAPLRIRYSKAADRENLARRPTAPSPSGLLVHAVQAPVWPRGSKPQRTASRTSVKREKEMSRSRIHGDVVCRFPSLRAGECSDPSWQRGRP